MEVEIDDKLYKGECKDVNVAEDEYNDAVASGHGAYMSQKGTLTCSEPDAP